MNEATIMFDNPALALVNAILLLGILLAVIAAPSIIRGTRELHKKNLAISKSFSDDGM